MTPAQERAVLEVARRHGTSIAAAWAGLSSGTVVSLRKRVDGYDRGRGHPTRAEIEAAKPSLTCDCGRCIDWRADEAIRSAYRHAATGPALLLEDNWDWRSSAACAGANPDTFFPIARSYRPADWDTPRQVCGLCTVSDDCLTFAIDNRIDYGMWGGLDENERRALRRRSA